MSKCIISRAILRKYISTNKLFVIVTTKHYMFTIILHVRDLHTTIYKNGLLGKYL